MNCRRSIVATLQPLLSVAAGLVLSSSTWTDEFPFRTAFERLPGVEAIEAGDIRAGIRILQDQLDETEGQRRGAILATLCAAYVIDADLDKAERTCNEAVESHGTATAYNNRGVYRVFTGDWSGARDDFGRASPGQLEAYIEELRTRDVRLMAADNFNRITLLLTLRSPTDRTIRLR